jgi:hypothetical protein
MRRQNYGQVFDQQGVPLGKMYSAVPIIAERQQDLQYIFWTPWVYDAALLSAQLFLWTFVWALDTLNKEGRSVILYAALLPIFGILLVLKHGKKSLRRALSAVAGMESVLAMGYWLGRKSQDLDRGRLWSTWVLWVVIYLFVIMIYGARFMTQIHGMRKPSELRR